MKNIFKGYYRLDENEFKSLWQDAHFIFDTNVLLNLYRYQSSTRDALLKVMEQLKGRVWIPYHVGLEFQRNRLIVIAEQHKRFTEVRAIVSKSISAMKTEINELQIKKRHSHINPDKLIEDAEKVQSDFFEELSKLEGKSITVNSDDEIRDRIGELFQGFIGSIPKNQQVIDAIFSEGENRYKNSIPPGYKDSSKDESAPDGFTYQGIIYKRKYGDLIIWKQIIAHALELKRKNIIFITDDNKDDWWWKVESNGQKTIGARPELKDEILHKAEVDNFHIYNTAGFLRYAKELLDAQVTKETIEEVSEISDERQEVMQFCSEFDSSIKRAVYEWLAHHFPPLKHNRHGGKGFDLLASRDGKKFGFKIKLIHEPRSLMYGLQDMVYRSYCKMKEEHFYEVVIIFVVLNESIIPELENCIRTRMPKMEGNLRIMIGKIEYSEEEESAYGFSLHMDFHFGHRM